MRDKRLKQNIKSKFWGGKNIVIVFEEANKEEMVETSLKR